MDGDAREIAELKLLDEAAVACVEVGALHLVPIGLFSIWASGLVSGWLGVPRYWIPLLMGIGLLFAVLGFWLMGHYAVRHHGHSGNWPVGGRQIRAWAVAWVCVIVMVYTEIGDFGTIFSFLGSVAGAAGLGWILVRVVRSGRLDPQSWALMSLFCVGAFMGRGSSEFVRAIAPWFLASLGGIYLTMAVSTEAKVRAVASREKTE